MIDSLEEVIKRFTNNAEYERTHGNLQGCLDFKQLAEWLRELKGYREARQELEDRHAVGTLDLIDSYIEEVNADEESE